MLRVVQHGLDQQAKEVRIAMKTAKGIEHSVGVQVSFRRLLKHSHHVVDERFAQRGEIDCCGEVEEGSLAVGKHGRQAGAAGSGEHRCESVPPLVQTSPQCGHEGRIAATARKFLHFVQQQDGRTRLRGNLSKEIVEVEE